MPHPGANAKFIAARRLNDHMRAQARPKLARVKEIRLRIVAEAHVHHRHTLGLLGQFLLHACRLIGHGLQFRLRLRKLCLRGLFDSAAISPSACSICTVCSFISSICMGSAVSGCACADISFFCSSIVSPIYLRFPNILFQLHAKPADDRANADVGA